MVFSVRAVSDVCSYSVAYFFVYFRLFSCPLSVYPFDPWAITLRSLLLPTLPVVMVVSPFFLSSVFCLFFTRPSQCTIHPASIFPTLRCFCLLYCVPDHLFGPLRPRVRFALTPTFLCCWDLRAHLSFGFAGFLRFRFRGLFCCRCIFAFSFFAGLWRAILPLPGVFAAVGFFIGFHF